MMPFKHPVLEDVMEEEAIRTGTNTQVALCGKAGASDADCTSAMQTLLVEMEKLNLGEKYVFTTTSGRKITVTHPVEERRPRFLQSTICKSQGLTKMWSKGEITNVRRTGRKTARSVAMISITEVQEAVGKTGAVGEEMSNGTSFQSL